MKIFEVIVVTLAC